MPHPSPFPVIDIPNVDIYTFLFDRKDKPFPDNHPGFIDATTKRTYTYADVRDESKRFGIGLESLWEWRKGDVLAIFSTNNIDTPIVTWGTLWSGGVVTPANPTYTVEELTYQLKDSGAKAVCTIPALYPIAAAAAANAGIAKDRIIFLGDKPAEGWPERGHSWKDIFDPSASVKWRKAKVDPEKDLAFLVYSSGTTGRPKGVMTSHRNIVANVLQFVAGDTKENMRWQSDRIIAFLPFFHIYGLTCIIHQGFYSGNPVIVMERFDLEKFCKTVQEEQITYVYAVPPVILLLAKHPIVSNYNLSCVRMINSGAAPLTRDLVEATFKRLRIPVKQGYGLSETSPVTHLQAWSEWRTCIGSVGKLVPNMTAKYMSEDGNELEPGQVGEIWMKGPNVMMGYLNNPEATKNAITEDGYFKTGDVGYVDKEGNLYITDRVKELIKYKGFQVPPAELEGLLAAHPKVDDVAVIGIFAPELATEVPRAYVVLAKGVEPSMETEQELIKYLENKVAQHKRLRGGVRFTDVIPKSASGKILRRILKDQAAKEEEERKVKAKL
ncbi:hypothetical protein BDZ91DRAFT_781993 [Kalaharituber pfeilii]|nr:hypothetical protein BDZ91DRAFT_781993 [Kalaharituber pfeilii]